MKVLVDSNILLDIFNKDPQWYEWSKEKLAEQANRANIVINPIVFAEISTSFPSLQKAQQTLRNANIKYLQVTQEVCYLAGMAFKQYRKNGGKKVLPLPDFFIGAHAFVGKMHLLTRDKKSYKTYFPQVDLIAPN
jgi:hypothetical protein